MDALILAGVALLALWVAIVVGRRRAVRKADEARARAQARRARVPVVSSNLLGQGAAAADLWQEAARAADGDEPPTPVAAPRPDR